MEMILIATPPPDEIIASFLASFNFEMIPYPFNETR